MVVIRLTSSVLRMVALLWVNHQYVIGGNASADGKAMPEVYIVRSHSAELAHLLSSLEEW
jgi:hypothetical protein